MNRLNAGLTIGMAMRDTERVLSTFSDRNEVRPGKAGLLAYCMSGKFVYRAAGVFADKIGAAIAMYGTRMITEQEDSAHLVTGQIAAETYFSYSTIRIFRPRKS